jgi:hypothetical protein
MTDTRTIELWFDALNTVWAVDDGRRRTVRTYRYNEFPDALNLGEGPAAINYAVPIKVTYGAPGSSISTIILWQGQTELHLTADVAKSNLGYIHSFYGRILVSAKANITLGGLVQYFVLEEDNPMVPEVLQYANEPPHHAIIIRWTVKQDLSGQI